MIPVHCLVKNYHELHAVCRFRSCWSHHFFSDCCNFKKMMPNHVPCKFRQRRQIISVIYTRCTPSINPQNKKKTPQTTEVRSTKLVFNGFPKKKTPHFFNMCSFNLCDFKSYLQRLCWSAAPEQPGSVSSSLHSSWLVDTFSSSLQVCCCAVLIYRSSYAEYVGGHEAVCTLTDKLGLISRVYPHEEACTCCTSSILFLPFEAPVCDGHFWKICEFCNNFQTSHLCH